MLMWWPVLTALALSLVGGLLIMLMFKQKSEGIKFGAVAFVATMIVSLLSFTLIGNMHLVPTSERQLRAMELSPLVINGQTEYYQRTEGSYESFILFTPQINPANEAEMVNAKEARYAKSQDGQARVVVYRIYPDGWWKLFALGGRDYRYEFQLPSNSQGES